MRISNLYISNSEKGEATLGAVVKKLWPLAVFVIAFLLGTDYVYKEYMIFMRDWANQSKVKRLLDNENPNEIPVFGASVARSSFTPDSISPNCYNYGMGKALFDVTRVLMKVECDKEKDTPIIFEVNPRTFIRNPKNTVNASTFIPLMDRPVIKNFMKESEMYSWHYMVPGLRFYGNYYFYTIGPLRRKTGEKKDNRGAMLENRSQSQEDVEVFVNRLSNLNARRLEILDKKNDPNQILTPEEEYALFTINAMVYFTADSGYVEEFEGYIRDNRNRQFILATVPANPLLKSSLPNFEEFTIWAQALADRHENAYYLDYSDFPTELDHYKDPTHFSEKGARIFSSAFSKDFRRITGIQQDGTKAF